MPRKRTLQIYERHRGGVRRYYGDFRFRGLALERIRRL